MRLSDLRKRQAGASSYARATGGRDERRWCSAIETDKNGEDQELSCTQRCDGGQKVSRDSADNKILRIEFPNYANKVICFGCHGPKPTVTFPTFTNSLEIVETASETRGMGLLEEWAWALPVEVDSVELFIMV